MSRQGSNHEIIELGEDEEDLDLPPPEDFDEAFADEEDDWFEDHDELDDEPDYYDGDECYEPPYDPWPEIDSDLWGEY